MEQLLQPSPGGIGRYSAALSTLLPGLFPDDELVAFSAWHRGPVAAGHAGSALTGGPGPGGSAAVRRLPLPRAALYECWHRLGPLPAPFDLGWALGWRLGHPDVIHAPSVAVPPKGASALVVTVHDMAWELFPDTYTPRGRRFHAAGVAAAAARADLIITVSESAAAEITSGTGITSDRVRVVPNGVSPRTVSPETRDATLARLGLRDRRYVLFVSSLEPRKGAGTLVAAFAALRRRGGAQEVALVLAGYPGWLSAGLIGAGDRRALGDGLRQLGAVSEDDLWPLYAGAELCAVPSVHEGFGLPVLEAMSQGRPVLCSDLPVLREVAGDAARYAAPGHTGAWADALEALLGDPAGQAALGAAGLTRSREFSWERCVRATRAVYAEALSGRR